MQCVGEFVDPAQEGDRFEIGVAAIAIGQPLAGLSRIVQIQHGGDGIDAQTVDVELVEPVEC